MRNFLLVVFILSIASLFGQSKHPIELKGKILEEGKSMPLPFAYATLKNANIGTASDENGVYSLNVPFENQMDSVVFSYLGYKTRIIPIASLINNIDVIIELKPNSISIKEVVVKPRKLKSPKSVLKSVIRNIPKNYNSEDFSTDNYYRETITENGNYIKYADASIQLIQGGYTNKNYKWKQYSRQNGRIHTLTSTMGTTGERLHRLHFQSRTLKKDRVNIVDSRSSRDLSETDMHANIEGGPLSIIGRDRLKFKESFLGKKSNKRFNYSIEEARYKDYGWVLKIHFKTVITKNQLEALNDEKTNHTKRWTLANKYKLLEGDIYVDPKSFAVLGYNCFVPNDLKQYFCGFKSMAVKHFDFKLNAEYKKIGDKYYLNYLKHEDEFIYKDTILNNVIPYKAVSELFLIEAKQDTLYKVAFKDNFSNLDANQLFDFPLEYDSAFWVNYTRKTALARIPDSIRIDMEKKDKLEKQFSQKHLKDENLKAPIAKKIEEKTMLHGESRIDNYAWMKNVKDPKHDTAVMAYVNKENEYLNNYFIPLRQYQRNIYSLLEGTMDKEYKSLPIKRDNYYYWVAYSEDNEYPFYLRKEIGEEIADTIVDVNKMAENSSYYRLNSLKPSIDHTKFAYLKNTTGNNTNRLMVHPFGKIETVLDSIENVVDYLWFNDSLILYSIREKKTDRIFQIKVHELGNPMKKDSILLTEKNKEYSLNFGKSKSKEYVYISSYGKEDNSLMYIRMDDPLFKMDTIVGVIEGHNVSVSDYDNNFYFISNKDDIDFNIYKSPISNPAIEEWEELFPKRKKGIIEDFIIFKDYWVVQESKKMETDIILIEKETGKESKLKFEEDIYTVSLGYNPEIEADSIQISYTSLKTPNTIYNYSLKDGNKRLVKQSLVKGYRKSKWVKQERIWVEAKDKTLVPVTLLYTNYLKNKNLENKRLYLEAYGSYGSSSSPIFSLPYHFLLSKGYVIAIAHVRGGGELGKKWYEDGKMMEKENTFSDFIDCAEHLIEEGYVEKGNIVAEGGSAGGLLMGVVANRRPELFKMIILNVPFVDVVNTMLDETLPLTTLEYEEWGNPNYKKHYKYINNYSPYDNVQKQDYPHLYFTTALNDRNVGYWEAAKMVAKLRDYKTDSNELLLKTELSAGHGGNSGRYSYYRDLSLKYALMFHLFSEDFKLEVKEDL